MESTGWLSSLHGTLLSDTINPGKAKGHWSICLVNQVNQVNQV